MAQHVKQHTVSRTYLKHFSLNEDGKDIYVINRADKYRPYIQKLNSGDSVFWEKNYYNSEKFATPTALEFFFANAIEPTYSGIVQRLKSHLPITEWQVKIELFQWIIYSKLRSPIWRAYYFELLDKAPEFRQSQPSFPIERLIKELHLTFFTDEAKLNQLMVKFTEVLWSKKWKILMSAKNSYWWTTDNPGFGIDLSIYEKTGEVVPDPCWNILSGSTLIYFPLSKDYCLQISPYNGGENLASNLSNTDIIFEEMDEENNRIINFWSLITQTNLLISPDKGQIEEVGIR